MHLLAYVTDLLRCCELATVESFEAETCARSSRYTVTRSCPEHGTHTASAEQIRPVTDLADTRPVPDPQWIVPFRRGPKKNRRKQKKTIYTPPEGV